MKCKILGKKGTWREVADSARTTIGKEAGTKEPSSNWKRRMLLAEHSPIRQIWIKAKWTDLKYWVSVHFVRHWLGIVHWISTQRDDRVLDENLLSRDRQPQSAFVEHEFDVDAQAMINISRKRLCMMASPETRDAWSAFLIEVAPEEPELVSVCVPDCIYRGYCFEYNTCGFYLTPMYKMQLEEYRKDARQIAN